MKPYVLQTLAILEGMNGYAPPDSHGAGFHPITSQC